MKQSRERVYAFDFMRVVSAMGIVLFHFSCHTNCGRKPLLFFANGDYGLVFVTIFFMMSGAMLYYNNKEIPSLKKFYFKRWKSIYPLFYMAFLYYYLQRVFETKQWFYMGNPKMLFLTLIGMDGYLSYCTTNYFLVGEWFVGAIVIVYLLYPLVLAGFKRSVLFTTIVIAGLYSLVFIIPGMFYGMSYHQNIFVCLLSFELGMLFMEYKEKLEHKWVLIVSVLLCLILCNLSLPINKNVAEQLLGISLFAVLYFVGNYVMKAAPVKMVITGLGSITYPIFLIQHQVILKVLNFRNPDGVGKMILVLLFTIGLIIVEAEILTVVERAVMKRCKL